MSGFEEETYSTIFTSLKHPVRRKILRVLSGKPRNFSEILDALGISSSHLTYHLENLGELISKTKDGKYKLSAFGEAAVGTMSKVEEAPKVREPKLLSSLSKKWKSFFLMLMIGIVVLAGVSYTQYLSLNRLSAQHEQLVECMPWLSVEDEVTEELFCPGPLGYSISTGVTKPREKVGVHFYAWKQDWIPLPGPVEYKLIRIDEEGTFISVVDQEIHDAHAYDWTTRVLDVAPAYYRFGVVIRDEDGGVFGKLIKTLYVPKQELNATMSLNKKEFLSGEILELIIHNEGPTTLFFGLYYTIEYLSEVGEWKEAFWLPPRVWFVGFSLPPGKSYPQSIELFPVIAGTYRVSKEVSADGTYISTTLAETFTVIQGTPEMRISGEQAIDILMKQFETEELEYVKIVVAELTITDLPPPKGDVHNILVWWIRVVFKRVDNPLEHASDYYISPETGEILLAFPLP